MRLSWVFGILLLPRLVLAQCVTSCANGGAIPEGHFGGVGSVPSGVIVLTLGAFCPAGYTEVTALSGKFILGTLAAGLNVGTTGGADNITPAGTVGQPMFTGNAFSSVINHTHAVAVIDPGHTHTQNPHTHTLPVGATDDTAAPFDRADAGTNASGANATTVSGSTTPTNNSAITGITALSSNPAGGVASITPSGTVSQPSFTGASFDNRPAFIRVIFCEKD